jgi:hypothetical protein
MVGQFQDERPALRAVQFLFHHARLNKINAPHRVSFVKNILPFAELVLMLEGLDGRQVLPFAVFHQQAVFDIAGKTVGIKIDHGGEF